MRLWPVLALVCLAPQALAAQVVGVRVTHSGKHYSIGMHIRVDAPPPAVFRALQDYAAMAHYDPDLRTVRVEPTAQADRVRLFTTIHACVLFFCKTMREEQIMTATADADGGALQSRLLPHGSDFKEGGGRWTVRPCPTGRPSACVDVKIELVPSFWVPPLIGPWIIRRKMYEEAHRASVGLEQIARKLVLHHAPIESTQSSSSKLLIR